ncbi:MAG: histidine kinase [Chitinophagaceae bacterium]|jgi:two-component sensor histidine kinase
MSKLTKKLRIEITAHLLVWAVLFYIPVALTTGTEVGIREIATHFWLQLGLLSVIFYINYLVLIKKLLFVPNRKVLFFATNTLIFVLLIFLKFWIYKVCLEAPADEHKRPPVQLFWYMDFLIYLIPLAFAIAIHAGKRMINMEVFRAEAETMRLQSELQHLKFQLQPHFFFNALNTIYSLIETDPAKAQQSIHSMSKLMRHLLAASDVEIISLTEEIDFLKKYIILMEQRLNKITKVEVDFPESIPDVHIVPLLFISIVENAFKHGVSAIQETSIRFSIRVSYDAIYFSSENTLLPKSASDLSSSGIGLANLRKRLQLLYIDNFILQSKEENNVYKVMLQIPLN